MAVYNVWINRPNPDDPDSSKTNKIVIREGTNSIGESIDAFLRNAKKYDKPITQIIITPNGDFDA